MKGIKSTEIASFMILMGTCFTIMGWYMTRSHVPVQEPAQVYRQFWV